MHIAKVLRFLEAKQHLWWPRGLFWATCVAYTLQPYHLGFIYTPASWKFRAPDIWPTPHDILAHLPLLEHVLWLYRKVGGNQLILWTCKFRMFLLRGRTFSPFSCCKQAHPCMLSFKLLELQTTDAFSLSIQTASQCPSAEFMQICNGMV